MTPTIRLFHSGTRFVAISGCLSSEVTPAEVVNTMSLTQNNYSHSTFTDHNIGNSGCAPDTKRSSVENGIKNFEIGSTFDNRNDRREYRGPFGASHLVFPRVIARRDAPK